MDTVVTKLPWGQESWVRIQQAVQAEVERVAIAQKFLPLSGPMPDALTVPADPIARDNELRLVMNEAAVSPLCEIWTEFTLTPQQAKDEAMLMKARTLAIRAARFVTLAEDALIFNGDGALKNYPLLASGMVRHRSGPAGLGSMGLAETAKSKSIDGKVSPGRAIFQSVTEAYAVLQDRGHYGPYALVLNTAAQAEVNAPPVDTFIFESDRLRVLFEKGLFGTGTLPQKPNFQGLLFSLGGQAMDLVIGRPAEASYLQEDPDGKFRFRVWKRFAFRLRDPSAVAHFQIEKKPGRSKS